MHVLQNTRTGQLFQYHCNEWVHFWVMPEDFPWKERWLDFVPTFGRWKELVGGLVSKMLGQMLGVGFGFVIILMGLYMFLSWAASFESTNDSHSDPRPVPWADYQVEVPLWLQNAFLWVLLLSGG